MAVIRCRNGHYYDDERFGVCPHCGVSLVKEEKPGEKKQEQKGSLFGWMRKGRQAESACSAADTDDDRTVAMSSQDTDEGADHTVAMGSDFYADDDDEKTISAASLRDAGAVSDDGSLLTGWIVCVRGPERGRDYRVHHEMNRIGRNAGLEICVMDDAEISGEKHCAIAYNAKKNEFMLVQYPGAATYFKDHILVCPERLLSGDSFTIGRSTFVFIAFCSGDRSWKTMQE